MTTSTVRMFWITLFWYILMGVVWAIVPNYFPENREFVSGFGLIVVILIGFIGEAAFSVALKETAADPLGFDSLLMPVAFVWGTAIGVSLISFQMSWLGLTVAVFGTLVAMGSGWMQRRLKKSREAKNE